MYNNWPSSGAWFAMGLMMLVLVGLIFALVLVVLRSLDQPPESTVHPAATGAENARRVLDERFARGEIDADEYRQRREVLRS